MKSTPTKIFITLTIVLTILLCGFSQKGFGQHQNFIEMSVGQNFSSSEVIEHEPRESWRVWQSTLISKTTTLPIYFINLSFQKITNRNFVYEMSAQYSRQKIKGESIYFDSEGVPYGFKVHGQSEIDQINYPIKFGYKFFSRFSITPKIGIVTNVNQNITRSMTDWSTSYDIDWMEELENPSTEPPADEFIFYNHGNISRSSLRPEYRINFSFLLEVEMSYQITQKISVLCSASYEPKLNFLGGLFLVPGRRYSTEQRPEYLPLFTRVGLKYNLGKRESKETME